MEGLVLTPADEKLLSRFITSVSLSGHATSDHFMIVHEQNRVCLFFETNLIAYATKDPDLNPIRIVNSDMYPHSIINNLLTKHIEETGFYNTANGIQHSLYCPIPCENCTMAFKCSVMSEDDRVYSAKPKVAQEDGPVWF